MTKIVGITGGIASGKSLISDWLLAHNYPLIDADLISRQVLQDDQTLLAKIRDAFGQDLINSQGQLDRQKLGRIIFNDADKRKQLNAIMQPPIRQKIEAQLQQLKKKQATLVFLTVPLLYEQHYENLCDAVIVVMVDLPTQILRLQARNKLSQKEAQARINAQMSLTEKIARANFVIDNNGSPQAALDQLQVIMSSLES